MAIIPNDEQFIGVSSSVDMTEKKSSQVNRTTQVYTLQDFSDSLTPDLTPITVDGNSVSIASDPTATTQAMAVIQATTLNSGIALVTGGAITAHVPDGGSAGGNARGAGAVDLQIRRVGVAATMVASGLGSVLLGGQRSTASGQFSFAMGNTNTASGNNSMSIGGSGNTASSIASAVLGGESNTASTGTHATVVGGQSNVSSGAHSISGGQGNTSSGQYSVSGGSSNTASGRSAVALGRLNNATAFESYAIGDGNSSSSGGGMSIGVLNNTSGGIRNYAFGQGNNVSSSGTNNVAIGTGNAINSGIYNIALATFADHQGASYSTSIGISPSAYLRNQFVHGSVGGSPVRARVQTSNLISYKDDTLNSAATTVLSLDGTGTTNLIIPLNNNRLWAAKVTATAFVNAVSGTTLVLGDSYMGEYTILFKRVGGTSSVVGVTGGAVISDTNMSTAAFNFSAGASQELSITFVAPTTASADTFRCVAKVELVEVAY